jgi:hypothetical protein
MLGGFTLFLINRKWSRIALVCLVPVCFVLAYFTSQDRINMVAACIGMTIIAAAPLIEWVWKALFSRFSAADDKTGADGQAEEDILDNKTKWRLIIAGYVIFILFAIVSIVSIIRLNAKINTLYGFTQDLDQKIEEVSDTKK